MAEQLIKITDLPAGTPEDDSVIPFVKISDNTTYKAPKSSLKGDVGQKATATAGTTSTLPAGQNATVTNVGTTSDAVFNFAIPQGIQGITGDTGAKVTSVAFSGNDIVFTLDDASTVTLTDAKTDLKGDTGLTGANGATGAKIVSASFVGDDMVFTLDDSTTATLTNAKITLKGATGSTGATGNGITSITKTGTSGLVDTYTILYTDTTTKTFTVTNGKDGTNGTAGADGADGKYATSVAFSGDDMVFTMSDNSTITLTNAKVDIKGEKGTTGDTGLTGNGIASVVKTGTAGLIDTYTITYTDSSTDTFTVTNGKDGTNGSNGTPGADGASFTWKGVYNGATAYVLNDNVSYNGSSYIAKGATTGNLPTNATYWDLLAEKGVDGLGAGDMLASVYDPAGKASQVEVISNKKTDLSDNSDTFYPSQKAVKTAVDGKQATLVSATNIKTINSISLLGSGNINTPNTEYTASSFDIKDLTDSTSLRSSWTGKQNALGFTPENVTNKVTAFSSPTDTQYPSAKLVKDQLDGKQASGSYLIASDITGKEDTSNKSTNVTTDATSDTKYPSVKAVKTYVDGKSATAGSDNIGYLNIPQVSKSEAYTLGLADSGKHILHPSADTTARTFTIPANSSVTFPIGTAITFINQNAGGKITIAITTDTMRLAGAGTTGSRTLDANGVATAIKITSTEWIISGTNLT